MLVKRIFLNTLYLYYPTIKPFELIIISQTLNDLYAIQNLLFSLQDMNSIRIVTYQL